MNDKIIQTDNITELYDLIYAGAKPVSEKISISQKKPNRNTKVEWKMKLERRITGTNQSGNKPKR